MTEALDEQIQQLPLDGVVRPSALVDELRQALLIAGSERFDGFAFAIEKQADEIEFAPVAALRAAKRRSELLNEVGELFLPAI